VSRKRTARRVWIPLPPRGLRPKLDKSQLTDLSLAHIVNLDLISHGQADEDVLWQMVGGVFTWARVAELLQVGQDDMAAQLELATRVVERYGRTGRIGFSGTEYQVAKRGTVVMDELAAIVDKPTAVAAAEWSEARVNALAERHSSSLAA
jgi:hypothetical protein